MNVLVLGGTPEGCTLAERIDGINDTDPGVRAIYSLAGDTTRRRVPHGAVRIGGFGGPDGLARYMRKERISVLIDATHPYAATMSAHAHEAAMGTETPLLRLERLPWSVQVGDDWHCVPDLPAARAAIPEGANVFLTIGRKRLQPFFDLSSPRVLVRAIEQPGNSLPAQWRIIVARPPFDIDAEIGTLKANHIDVLVSKNSGGHLTYTKIEAARHLAIPVIMIERPLKPDVPCAPDIDSALAWLETKCNH